MSKCAVCGRDGETFVACSMCGGITLRYCHDCLLAGVEPWDELVNYIAICGNYPEDIDNVFCDIVRDTCERLGKTEDDFIKDVNTRRKEYGNPELEWIDTKKELLERFDYLDSEFESRPDQEQYHIGYDEAIIDYFKSVGLVDIAERIEKAMSHFWYA